MPWRKSYKSLRKISLPLPLGFSQLTHWTKQCCRFFITFGSGNAENLLSPLAIEADKDYYSSLYLLLETLLFKGFTSLRLLSLHDHIGMPWFATTAKIGPANPMTSQMSCAWHPRPYWSYLIETYLLMFRDYFWLLAQESPLALLETLYVMPGTKSGLAICKK